MKSAPDRPQAIRFLGYEVGYFARKHQIGLGAAEYIIANIGADRVKLDAVGVLFAKL